MAKLSTYFEKITPKKNPKKQSKSQFFMVNLLNFIGMLRFIEVLRMAETIFMISVYSFHMLLLLFQASVLRYIYFPELPKLTWALNHFSHLVSL